MRKIKDEVLKKSRETINILTVNMDQIGQEIKKYNKGNKWDKEELSKVKSKLLLTNLLTRNRKVPTILVCIDGRQEPLILSSTSMIGLLRYLSSFYMAVKSLCAVDLDMTVYDCSIFGENSESLFVELEKVLKTQSIKMPDSFKRGKFLSKEYLKIEKKVREDHKKAMLKSSVNLVPKIIYNSRLDSKNDIIKETQVSYYSQIMTVKNSSALGVDGDRDGYHAEKTTPNYVVIKTGKKLTYRDLAKRDNVEMVTNYANKLKEVYEKEFNPDTPKKRFNKIISDSLIIKDGNISTNSYKTYNSIKEELKSIMTANAIYAGRKNVPLELDLSFKSHIGEGQMWVDSEYRGKKFKGIQLDIISFYPSVVSMMLLPTKLNKVDLDTFKQDYFKTPTKLKSNKDLEGIGFIGYFKVKATPKKGYPFYIYGDCKIDTTMILSKYGIDTLNKQYNIKEVQPIEVWDYSVKEDYVDLEPGIMKVFNNKKYLDTFVKGIGDTYDKDLDTARSEFNKKGYTPEVLENNLELANELRDKEKLTLTSAIGMFGNSGLSDIVPIYKDGVLTREILSGDMWSENRIYFFLMHEAIKSQYLKRYEELVNLGCKVVASRVDSFTIDYESLSDEAIDEINNMCGSELGDYTIVDGYFKFISKATYMHTGTERKIVIAGYKGKYYDELSDEEAFEEFYKGKNLDDNLRKGVKCKYTIGERESEDSIRVMQEELMTSSAAMQIKARTLDSRLDKVRWTMQNNNLVEDVEDLNEDFIISEEILNDIEF